MGQAQGQPARSARCIALVGPYLSGKTTLLESILARTGAITRQGSMAGGNTVGDASEEARHHGMSVELNVATVDFLGDSIRADQIRAEDDYGGWRTTIQARLGAARLTVQVDVGIGDAVTPAPEWLDYPGLLDLPRPRLRAYPRESVASEKLHAIVLFGIRNSRMKDYFDLHALAREGAVDAAALGEAIAATFTRRTTEVPSGVPPGLRDDFARDLSTQAQWKAFLARNRLAAPPLANVVSEVREFAMEPLRLARIRVGQTG